MFYRMLLLKNWCPVIVVPCDPLTIVHRGTAALLGLRENLTKVFAFR